MLPVKKYRQNLHATWGFAHTQNAKGEDSLQTFKKFFCEILKQLWKSTYLCSWKIRWRTSSIKWNSSWRFPNGKKTFWRWQHRNRKHRHLRSLRKHPFLLALPRETSPATKSEEKRMFSQATIYENLLDARFTLLWRHDGQTHRTAALTSLWLPPG